MNRILLTLLLLPFPAFAAAEHASLSLLSSAEKSYYTQIFSYTMDNTMPGEKYSWKTHSGQGLIHVDEVFVSKSGAQCRNYSETFSVQGVGGAYQGVACRRRGDDGWCRLKPGNAHTCAMEDPAYMFDIPTIDMPNMGGIGGIGSPNININTGGAEAPTINGPNMDKPKAPNTDKAAQSFSDTVTGGAGKAAGKAASTGFGWFFKTFGR